MIPSWAKKEVYQYFDEFLEKCILGNDSYITNNPGIFTIENINNCVSAFVDKPDESDRSFDAKSQDQFSDSKNKVKEVFAHFIWLWGLPASDMSEKKAVIRFLGEEYNKKLNNVFVDGGVGSGGQRHKLNKPFEIAYLLLLVRDIKKNIISNQINCINDLKKHMVKLCEELYYNNNDTTLTNDEKLKKAGNEYLAMHHLVLHLCNPEKYEAIAAQKHKDAIINTFYSLLEIDNADDLFYDIDDNIYKIRKKLEEIFSKEISFYDDEIYRAWNFSESKDDISEVTLFEYKKAMIFYGPPGTSKTYSANRIAELLVAKQYFRSRQNIKEYFDNSKEILNKHIHHLQLHSNYNYEDFIVGIHIEDKSTVVKPGYLLNLIEKIKDDKLPHILILDEINRTDLSRLFGELFSALEYRNKAITLSIGDLNISLPDNLYFIGTMNEIDFSLERIDFALRRRFLWHFKGFDREILQSMIYQKIRDVGLKISENDIETYIERCEGLINAVSTIPELGESYQIGHTFFAEIIDIFKTLKTVHARRRLQFLVHPVNVLWEISIKPILQAFLGNMDATSKQEKLKELQKVFTDE